MTEAPYGRSNLCLTVVLITPEKFGADREQIRLALEEENIEARPVWKPMHLQPVFRVDAQGARRKAPQYDLPDLRGRHSAQRHPSTIFRSYPGEMSSALRIHEFHRAGGAGGANRTLKATNPLTHFSLGLFWVK